MKVHSKPPAWEFIIAKRDAAGGPDTYDVAIHPSNSGTDRLYMWWTLASDSSFVGYVSDDSHRFRLGQWDHWVVVRDDGANTVKMYRNGEDAGASLVSGSHGTAEAATNSVTIGGSTYSSEDVNASIDDIRIYNRVLATSSIQRLYDLGR